MDEGNRKSDDYTMSRNFSANVRLTMQYYLNKSSGMSYLLHPSIPSSLLKEENLKVAEIGVGTCVWLVEVAETLPKSAQLEGLDVSFDQSPPEEWLPPNVSLVKHDAFSDPPLQMVGKYDIIHIQLFMSLVKEGDPVPLLQNFMKMLKPGGYIQWGEWDTSTYEIIRTPSAPSTTNNELNELLQYVSSLGGSRPGPTFINVNWVANLHGTLNKNGFDVIAVDRRRFDNYSASLLLDAWMTACEEITVNMLDTLSGGQGEIARGMIEKVAKNKKNTTFNVDRVVVVGQKLVNRK